MSTIFKSLRYGAYSVLAATVILALGSTALADGPPGSPGDQAAKFRQLNQDLPTPNIFRNAAGAPGPA